MKILRLSFRNLNSLAGDWEIDFTHPEFVSSGIFAITGPTGAGKSTILDAICLALYGQTPRLGRITQSDNEIMARQTGECSAEVDFETAKGRFRCHWSQHRSRKLADGQLQQPRHEIAAAESGLILEAKLRAVTDKVEEVTGMDFDRFTRSMLLAQGGFAAFLQARPDERAPILEQITGTAIYSRISIKVHERTVAERRRLEELRAELAGIQLLSPEEIDRLQREKSELLQAETALAAQVRISHAAQLWRERITALKGELQQLHLDRQEFELRKTAAAPELERLTLAGRALTLAGEHAHLLALRLQQGREQGELQEATARLPNLELGRQTAFAALQQAESGLILARTGQAAEAELIRRTRELDVRLGEAGTSLRALAGEIEVNERQNSDLTQAVAAGEQRIKGVETDLLSVAAFLDQHRADAGLTGELTGIEQQLKSLTVLDKQCFDMQAGLERQATQLETASRLLSRAEAAWLAAQQAVAGAEARLADLRDAGAILLQGRELAAWRGAAEMLASRQSLLGTLQETVARLEGAGVNLAALQLRVTELQLQKQALAAEEAVLAGEADLREQMVRQVQDKVLLLNRVRSLEEDRRQLVDGLPCPLCGSGDHPYAVGNIPRLDGAQQELETALASAKGVREQLDHARLRQVALDKDLQQAAQQQSDLQGRQQDDEALFDSGCHSLEISAAAGDRAELVLREAVACQEGLLAQRSVIRQVEQLEQEERNGQAAVNLLRDQLAGQDRARLAARLGVEAALAEQKRLEGEATARRADLDRMLAEVAVAVAAYAPGELLAEQAGQLLALLTARRTAYLQQLQEKERLERARVGFAAETGQQRVLLAESVRALRTRQAELQEKVARREELVRQRLELYGQRNPDLEEKRLTAALHEAEERRETALKEHNRLQAELGGATGEIDRLTASLGQRSGELSALEGVFVLRLAEAGFATEALFLQASLPQDLFAELSSRAEALQRDETALLTRQADCRKALAAELDKQLTDKPLELLREEHAAVTGQLSELQKTCGGIELKLQQHAEQLQRHQTRLEAITLQKRECDRWEQLHGLIGSGDGKKFRNFAQGLTFELMVAHANRQLQKMSDRYLLVRDSSAPLELNVIDNYQAGEIRSTKNLSGGESFIASLALSLGLSSMASRNVRVDSLFLDEGFGTLDEDALETALETLAGLQQDGKLIGIISHVPALKERIGTRIQVETGSGGRSCLNGPGCRKVG